LPSHGIAGRCKRRIIGINGGDIIFVAGGIGRIIKIRGPGAQIASHMSNVIAKQVDG
jgi:hypothetical protein